MFIVSYENISRCIQSTTLSGLPWGGSLFITEEILRYLFGYLSPTDYIDCSYTYTYSYTYVYLSPTDYIDCSYTLPG